MLSIFIFEFSECWGSDARSDLLAVEVRQTHDEGIAALLAGEDVRLLLGVDVDHGVRRAAGQSGNRSRQVHDLTYGVDGAVAVVTAGGLFQSLGIEVLGQVVDLHCSSPGRLK